MIRTMNYASCFTDCLVVKKIIKKLIRNFLLPKKQKIKIASGQIRPLIDIIIN